jgi:hypothetical protein
MAEIPQPLFQQEIGPIHPLEGFVRFVDPQGHVLAYEKEAFEFMHQPRRRGLEHVVHTFAQTLYTLADQHVFRVDMILMLADYHSPRLHMQLVTPELPQTFNTWNQNTQPELQAFEESLDEKEKALLQQIVFTPVSTAEEDN